MKIGRIVILVMAGLFFLGAAPEEDKAIRRIRNYMVRGQIEARGVRDKRLLEALRKVPRHKFVPSYLKGVAYSDAPLPIGKGQTISQPYIVAVMTELLILEGDEKVLEIGTGSGYQAAVLGELAAEVYSIEIVKSLAKRAKDTLASLGYTNIRVKQGDGYLGWPEAAPFDAIIVTAAPAFVPQPLIDQLAEGGRLVLPVGKQGSQTLKLIVKEDGKPVTTDGIDVRFVPMTGMIEDMDPPEEKTEYKTDI